MWRKQSSAIIRPIQLKNGRKGIVILIGGRENEKNAVVVFQTEGGGKEIFTVKQLIDELQPDDLIDILCVQERVFGNRAIIPLTIE